MKGLLIKGPFRGLSGGIQGPTVLQGWLLPLHSKNPKGAVKLTDKEGLVHAH